MFILEQITRRHKAITWIMLSIIGLFALASTASAGSLTLTSGSDWDSGTKVGLDTSIKEGDLQLDSAGVWGARSWKTPDFALTVGTAFTTDGTNIYMMRGLGNVAFWKYDTTNDAWTNLAKLPFGAYYGADLEVVGSYVYALFGGYQSAFARYSITNNTWEVLTQLPGLAYDGASLTNDGTNLYALRANSSQDFYKYTVATGVWSALSGPPATIAGGADLVRVGNYIYTPRGASTTTFYRYDITANTWSSLAVLPGTIGESNEITTDGTYIYVARGIATNTFYRYTISNNTWATVTNLPGASRYAGTVYVSNDGYVYVFRGNTTYQFWKYNPTTQLFIGPEDAPAGLGTGSDIVYSNSALFVPRGTSTTTMYKYTLATGAWSTVAVAPATIADDTKGVAVGTNVYFFRGSNTLTFYRYNTVADTWSTLADALATIGPGASLAYPGSGDYIYGTRGATTTKVYRYSISGNSWDDASIADLPTGINVTIGSRMVASSTDLYLVPGNGLSRFYKYTIASDTWTEITTLPFTPYYGTDLAINSGKIFALAGWNKSELWEYLISGDSWRKLESFAAYYPYDQGAYNGASIEFDQTGTFYATRGIGLTEILTYTPSVNNYVATGTWTSPLQDLGFVSSWTAITPVTTTPGDSQITLRTRTSADGVTWDDWQDVVGTTIASTPRRYLQIQATLLPSTGATSSPTLHSIAVTYAGDTTAPTNPTTTTGTSQAVAGVALTSGQSYPYTHPYFTWSGATDASSSIAGYYVYFGTNATADPQTAGHYQTVSTYSSTTALAANTYYLRIKTADSAGNVSAASTLFTYVYTGVSPVQSLLVGDTASFTGTANSVNTSGDSIKLSSRTGGFWKETALSYMPAGAQYGAQTMAYTADSGRLYVFRGALVPTFYSYEIATDTWTTLANAPANVRIGGGVIEGPSGYLYGMPGENLTSFWRYDITNNVWSDEAAADFPLTVYYGGSLAYDGTQHIYVLRGNDDDAFWRYDTAENVWQTLADANFGAPSNAVGNGVYIGGDMAIDQANGLVYAIQGNYRDGFSVYNTNTNSWTVLTDLPSLPQLGASIEFDTTTSKVFFIPGNSTDLMFAYDPGTQQWTQMATAPARFAYGASLRAVGGAIYAIRGENTTSFYKYNIAKNSWLLPSRGLFGRVFQGTNLLVANYGSDLLKGDGNNFYITRGNYANDFIRWNESTGTVTRMANLPTGIYNGASMVYDSTNNKIYLTGGITVQRFYVYDVATNVWSTESSDPPPASLDYGSSMVYDGSRYIYLTRGGTLANLYRFDTQGSSGSKWSTLTSSPVGLGYGSELAINGNYLYALRGQNVANNPFYRYDIAANTWSDPAVADMSTLVYNDGFLANGGDGKLYAAKASNLPQFYSYSISGNTWSQLGNIPANIYTGASGEGNGSNHIYAIAGGGTNAYSDAIYSYVIESAQSGFVESGDYTSQSHDLTSVYKWSNLEVEYTAQTGTGLTIQTRTSSDNSSWSSWTAVSEAKNLGTNYLYRINSPANRYIQVKFLFTSTDGVRSGALDSYNIHYYRDTTAPSNPETAGLSAYSHVSTGSAIVSNTWYPHVAPSFDWADDEATNGASDTTTGSGVAGYYVYFGVSAAADPQVDGQIRTDSSFTASGLVTGQTYYLRIKAFDDAGNVAATAWEPFIYKYDNGTPAAPANLNADPSGYTATNNFDFSWDVASKSGAPVTSYCYKTGTSSGVLASDQCITETAITDITAYKVGANTFYVRTKDSASNYSDYATASYYYVDSDNAPAPPTNLSVTPSTNTSNSFAFSWDPPAAGTFYGSQANLSYYFSINALPTAQSTTATSLTSLAAGAYATLPGDNVFYITTKDEAGNINYSDYASVTFTANTTAPGIPLNLDIADVSVKSTKSWKLALSWEAPSTGTVSNYSIYRSVDGVTFTEVATSGGISFVDVSLLQKTYYYKIKACDSTNNCGEFSDVVSLYPDGKFVVAAELIGEPDVSGVTTRKATVSWSTARTADSKISYGLAAGDYFDTEVSNSDQVTAHELNLTNLSPGTTYYFVVKWTDEDGNTGTSDEATFSTDPPPSTAEPIVRSIGLDSALIEFTSSNADTVNVYYGETSAFGGVEEVATGTSEGTHRVLLTGLKDGTKYYYKINSFDIDGEEYEGEIHSFSTLPRPKISNIKVNQVKGTAQSTLLLTWSSNTKISSIVTYYPSAAPSAARDEVNIALKDGLHQMILYNLMPESSYTLIIRGKDAAGNEAVGEPQQVTTASDTRVPLMSELKVEGSVQGAGEEATAQLVVSFKTDEPATTQVEFGEGTGSTYSQKTQLDSTLVSNHLVVISELTPGKVFHLRALAKDAAGNQSESIDKVVITPKATDNALDLVVTNLGAVFGFLKAQ